MSNKILRIGTRESQLAVWQANTVKDLLYLQGIAAELIYIKSEGDIDLSTPLYEIGVQGIFTRALDIALLKNDIDIAVHSMKDVPTLPATGITQAAVLPRASYKDLLVLRDGISLPAGNTTPPCIATSSIRRKAQWLNRYPGSVIENLRGNINTRLRKVQESHWHGAIFAAAGLERINLRPETAIELDWMLPAPAQGAILVACRAGDEYALNACKPINDAQTDLCTAVERDFLRALLGGCATPISALATIENDKMYFEGSILSVDGMQKIDIKKIINVNDAANLGNAAALELLADGGREILEPIRNGK